MANRSFTDYIATRFRDELFDAIQECIEEDFYSLELYSKIVKNIEHAELVDITVKQVRVGDLPNSRIQFDVLVEGEIEVRETSFDVFEDTVNKWFIVRCVGDLGKQLDDFEIESTECGYEKNRFHERLSDSLVPILTKEKLEEEAEDFLVRNYREGLTSPIGVSAVTLADAMGLNVVYRHLSSDNSIFGQICFSDCELEVYSQLGGFIKERFPSRTILVDPNAYFLRSIGTVNNTIVHECVHWDKHRKAFMLEQLYNSNATQIRCMVLGGIKDTSVRSPNDWMEWQANALAPRIQMPFKLFKAKAQELILQYKQDYNTENLVDIIEPVIDDLATVFGVSRQAAKIRMIDVGYQEAMGAFEYVDGHYVSPYRFKENSISKSQTYCISAEDAMFIDFSSQRLYSQTAKGAYIYVDSHLCLNSPKYVRWMLDGSIAMTDYGRLHIDECCLAFDIKVKSGNKYAEAFYKECVLFKYTGCGIEYEITFSEELNGNLLKQAEAMLGANEEIQDILQKIASLSFNDSLKAVMEWAEINEHDLAERALLNIKTIQRMRNNSDYPKKIESVVAICIAMHLPPEVSNVLIEKSGFGLRVADNQSHLMYRIFLTKYYIYSVSHCNALLREKELPPIADYDNNL